MKRTLLAALLLAALGLNAIQLNLDESVQRAIESNKDLEIARQEVGVYQQEYKNVRGNILPQVSLEAGYQYKKTYMPDAYVPSDTFSSMLEDEPSNYDAALAGTIDALLPQDETDEYSAAATVKVSQPLFLGGKLINGISIAGKLYHLEEKKYFVTEQQVIFDTKDKFYQTKLAAKVVDIQMDALSFARKYASQVNDMYAQGLVSEYDKLRSDLEVKKLEPQVLEAKKNYELAMQSFKDFLNIEEDLELIGEIEIPEMDDVKLEAAMLEAKDERIELELSAIGLDVSNVYLRIQKGNFLPNIALSGEYSYFGQSDKSSIESDEFGSYYQFGIGFSMPLFTGLSNTAKIAKAKHQLKQTKLSHQDLQEKIKLDVRNSYRSWQTSMEKVNVQEENMALAERGLEIAEARYENQISNQLEVIDAQLQLKSVKLSYYSAAYEAAISYEQLKKAMGRNL